MKIYCDESGTHSNRYLVIAAVIVDDNSANNRLKNRVRRSIAHLKKADPSVTELHAKDLNTAQKEKIINGLTSKSDYRVAYLVADKTHIAPSLKAQPNLCYNFLFGVLMKKVLANTTEDIVIVCDNRTVRTGSKNSLPDYIKLEAYANWGLVHKVSVDFQDSQSVKNLQVADIIANTIYAKYNLGKSHLYSLHDSHYSHKVIFPYRKFGT